MAWPVPTIPSASTKDGEFGKLFHISAPKGELAKNSDIDNY
jgi:hypothetical protein